MKQSRRFTYYLFTVASVLGIVGLLGMTLTTYANDNRQRQDVSVFVRKGHPYDLKQTKTTMPARTALHADDEDTDLLWPDNRSDLQRVLQFALNNHPDVLLAIARRRAAEQTLRSTQGGFLPVLEAEVAYGPERTDNAATRATGANSVDLMRQEKIVRIRQLLYDGGKVFNRVKRDTSELESSRESALSTRETVSLRVVDAYISVLRTREKLGIAAEDVRVHRENVRKTNLRLKGGAGRKSELELADTRLAEAQARYAVAQTQMQAANNNFAQRVGKKPPRFLAKTALNPSQVPQRLTNARTLALKGNPAVAVARADVDAAGHNIAALHANYLPDVSLEMEASRNNELDGVVGANNEDIALVRARYNLYNGGQDRAEIKKAIEERNQTLQALAEIRRNVTERVSTAWTDMKTNLSRYRLLQKNVADAKKVVDSYKKEFSLGQRSLLNVLDAENEYFRARTNFVDAHFAYLLSQYRVLEAMGVLSATILAS